MDIDEYYRALFTGKLPSSAWHLEECDDDDCEACHYLLLEFYSACDGCGHWMNKDVFYHYHQDTGHTYCLSCEEKIMHP